MKKNLFLIIIFVNSFISSFVFGSDEIESFLDYKMDEESNIESDSRDWAYFKKRKFTITRIGYELKATYCNDYPKCPEIKVVIHLDGSFVYKGEHLKLPYKNGKFEGSINLGKTFEIFDYIELSDSFKNDRIYALQATHLILQKLIIERDGKRNIVVNYGNAAPSHIGVIFEVIENALILGKWESIENGHNNALE